VLLLDLGSFSVRNSVKGMRFDLGMQFCVSVSGQPCFVTLVCNSTYLLFLSSLSSIIVQSLLARLNGMFCFVWDG